MIQLSCLGSAPRPPRSLGRFPFQSAASERLTFAEHARREPAESLSTKAPTGGRNEFRQSTMCIHADPTPETRSPMNHIRVHQYGKLWFIGVNPFDLQSNDIA